VGPGLLGVVVAPLGEHEAGQPRAR
jgi:hypothetical protein